MSAQPSDVVPACPQVEPQRARPSIRLKPLLVAASAGALFLKAPPRAEAAPVNTSPPAIAGVLEPERTLTATPGTWTDAKSPIVGYQYQWLRCIGYSCTDIDYENYSTFTLGWGMAGTQTEVMVTAIDAKGEFSFVTSEETNVIADNGPHYTLSEIVSGNGSVTGTTGGSPNPLLACPGGCGASYPYRPGTRIQLTATPRAGATFEGWQGACAGSAPTCSVTLGGNEAVMAVFSYTGVTTPPVLPLGGSEGRAREAQPPVGSAAGGGAPSGEAPNGEAWEAPAPSAPGLRARLLSLRALRHHIHASVKCLQARPCRLSLGLFARTSAGLAVIAQRSFTVAAGRSARITLTLSRQGQRLLARRHRLAVTARLTLGASEHSALVEQRHLTLTSG